MSDQGKPANGCGTDAPMWDGPTYWNDDDRRRDYCSQVCADARKHIDGAEHPAPWTWETWDGQLHDATGCKVIDAIDEDGRKARAYIRSPLARELIRLAPEMAALLRALEWTESDGLSVCPSCGHRDDNGHLGSCTLASLLAALDATRKATP